MALYLGNGKVKISINDILHSMKFFSEIPITNGIRLLSSEGYILKDSNGVYLTVKEDE